MNWTWFASATICVWMMVCHFAVGDTLRVYHIGNSVTDTIRYAAFQKAAQLAGHTYIFGRHMIPGAPLSWIWEHSDSGFREEPFGYYPKALQGYEWDVLTLQPFDRLLEGSDDSDFNTAKRFIELALPKSPRLRVYIYSRWPRKNEDGSLDYEAKWLRKFTGGWDSSNETRDYFEQLVHRLRQEYPMLRNRLFVVPVADVMLELHRRMKRGAIRGYTDIGQVYADGIHLNDVGSYIVGCTFFATLYRQAPSRFSGEPYGVTDTELTRKIQDTVWQVVSKHPLAGVARAARARDGR
jgi:hypothetical protein